MVKIPEHDSETEMKKHLRNAVLIISNVGSGLGMRADQHSQMAAQALVEAAQHIEQAVLKFKDLRN